MAAWRGTMRRGVGHGYHGYRTVKLDKLIRDLREARQVLGGGANVKFRNHDTFVGTSNEIRKVKLSGGLVVICEDING